MVFCGCPHRPASRERRKVKWIRKLGEADCEEKLKGAVLGLYKFKDPTLKADDEPVLEEVLLDASEFDRIFAATTKNLEGLTGLMRASAHWAAAVAALALCVSMRRQPRCCRRWKARKNKITATPRSYRRTFRACTYCQWDSWRITEMRSARLNTLLKIVVRLDPNDIDRRLLNSVVNATPYS